MSPCAPTVIPVFPLRRSDAALVATAVVSAVALCAAVATVDIGNVAFSAFLLAALLAGVRRALRTWVRAAGQRRSARALAQVSHSDSASRVVAEENERIAGDIRVVLRRTVDDMALQVTRARQHGPPDPAGLAPLRSTQELGVTATTELRRMLGLLRSGPGWWGPQASDAEPHGSPAVATWVAPGIGSAALAVVLVAEHLLSGRTDSSMSWSGVTSVRHALTIAAMLVFLLPLDVALATACTAAVVVLGVVLGAPVFSGLWLIVTLGTLTWRSIARPAREPWCYVALGCLVGAVMVSLRSSDPLNVPFVAVVLSAVAVTAFVMRVGEALHHHARVRAVASERQVARATAEAVREARLKVARDLHDSLSGTVGVVVTQAGAAEVHWATDPERARAALEVVAAALDGARRDLDLMVPVADRPLPHHSLDDIPGLVERLRGAGVDACLDMEGGVDGSVPAQTGAAAYRIVQECLANVARHAPGAHTEIRIRLLDRTLEVVVDDDGPGAVPESVEGFGLRGLHERVAALGGTVSFGAATLHPAPRGWRVAARIPVRAEEDEP